MKIYIFDTNNFFEDDIKIMTIDNIRTVYKENRRAVLNVAVKEAFGSNENLFLQFIDKNVAYRDDVGLFVVPVDGPTELERELGQKELELERELGQKELELGEQRELGQTELKELGQIDEIGQNNSN